MTDIISKETSMAFSEVYDIIGHMEKDLYKKIPKDFIYMLKEYKDNRIYT